MVRLSLFLFLSIIPVVSIASPRVGNGGGVWVCQNESFTKVRWMHFVDLFEAENEFGLSLAKVENLSEWQIYTEKMKLLRKVSPEITRLIRINLSDLLRTIKFLPESTELTQIEDAFIRVRPSPSSCLNGYLYYGQLANFTFDGRLLISSKFWNDPEFSKREKAALLVHETIYKTLRDHYGDENSSRSRFIVGILFSTLPVDQQKARISRKLKDSR
ncbi:MAG: hypothetical protein M9962_01215 [Oligoflexia bacterium]|nr:hypothetical protein [Oligoflexia bacterium]